MQVMQVMEPPHGGEEQRKDCVSRVSVESLRQKPGDVPVGCSSVACQSLSWKYLLFMNEICFFLLEEIYFMLLDKYILFTCQHQHQHQHEKARQFTLRIA